MRVLALADRRMIARDLLDPLVAAACTAACRRRGRRSRSSVLDDGHGEHAGHAVPFGPQRRDADESRCWRSVIASRMRSAIGPVSRSSRARSIVIATSAALPPAAWPPTPSTTMKRPRAASTWKRSSLTSRCRPGSVSPAAVTTLIVFIDSFTRSRSSRPLPIQHSDAATPASEDQQDDIAPTAAASSVERLRNSRNTMSARPMRAASGSAVSAPFSRFAAVAPRRSRAERGGRSASCRACSDRSGRTRRSADRGGCARARATRRPTRRCGRRPDRRCRRGRSSPSPSPRRTHAGRHRRGR